MWFSIGSLFKPTKPGLLFYKIDTHLPPPWGCQFIPKLARALQIKMDHPWKVSVPFYGVLLQGVPGAAVRVNIEALPTEVDRGEDQTFNLGPKGPLPPLPTSCISLGNSPHGVPFGPLPRKRGSLKPKHTHGSLCRAGSPFLGAVTEAVELLTELHPLLACFRGI